MRLTRAAWWCLASLVLMVVGAFGPWAKVLFITINGTDGGSDGWFVVGAAVVAGIFLALYLRRRRTWLVVLPLLAGCLSAAVAAYDIADINNIATDELGSDAVSAQWGIYAALVGSTSLVLACVALIVETRRAAPLAATEAPATPEPPTAEPPPA